MSPFLQIKRLSEADAASYCALRRRAAEELTYPPEPQVRDEAGLDTEGITARLLEYAVNGTCVWGAFCNGILVGTAALGHEQHRAYGGIGLLWGVYVLPRYRGTPTSRLLMETVIERCSRDKTVDQILAACASDNAAGQLFLLRFGFEPMRLLIRDGSIHGHGGDFLYLRRLLP